MVNRDIVRTPQNNTCEVLRELVTELNVMATEACQQLERKRCKDLSISRRLIRL
jgi:hypothetical protein